jgi:hypothetical protein
MQIKKYIFITVLLIIILFPVISFAQSQVGNNVTFNTQSSLTCSLGVSPKIGDLLSYGTCIIGKSVIPLIFALAIVSFIWGVVQYVINNDEESKKAKGKQFMIWGIIALSVMVSVWGLVKILGNTFNIDSTFIPKVDTSQ